jgi:hypothetical protein
MDRQRTEARVAQATADLENARSKAAANYQSSVAAFGSAADSVNRESTAWAAYYQKISEGARGGPPAPLLSSVLKSAPPDAAPSNPPAPAAPSRAPSITLLPLARYTGAWTYSDIGGQFHGNAPEFVDLVVHADGNKMSGTFFGRFKLPAGSKDDPLVRFDFEGEQQPSATQSFKLVTSDNLAGSVDLIPGTAFNLLEVTFTTDAKPGKIHQGDLLLVKK